MELRVESVDGTAMPVGCYVGVRVGDVLKQGRYEPQRCYHFPQVDRRRNAKIDVYQHVGSCVVAVDPETKSTHEVKVNVTDPAMPDMRLKVQVQSKGEQDNKQQREARTKALKNQAKDYLSKHSIEERLSEAVKALLKEQPSDPTDFLCRQLRGGADDPMSPGASPKNAAGSKPGAGGGKDLMALRQQACDVLMKASCDGELCKVLEEIKAETQASTGAKANALPPPEKVAAAQAGPPPFVINKSPPTMLPSHMLAGPAFATLGMPHMMMVL